MKRCCGMLLAVLLAHGMMASLAHALAIDAPLGDPAQEARAKALFYELRCMVCQSESVADSPAEIARDIRALIRDRIAAGQTEESIKHYLAARYGEGILMQPPLKAHTLLLWLGPALLLCAGGLMARSYFKNAKE